MTYVDRSRPTQAHADQPGLAERTLPTTVVFPQVEGSEQLAVVVFAHGYGGNPSKLATFFKVLAEHGYVVVSPRFPLTSNETPGGTAVVDYVNQPADLSFVLDQLLAHPPEGLAGHLDRGRIGLVGHSMGGATVMGSATHPCCRDKRFRAVVVLAGANLAFPQGAFLDSQPQLPILWFQGTADTSVTGDFRLSELYDKAGAPKFRLTVDGATHTSAVEGLGASPQIDLVSGATTDFLDRYLRGDPSGLTRLDRLVRSFPDSKAHLESQP